MKKYGLYRNFEKIICYDSIEEFAEALHTTKQNISQKRKGKGFYVGKDWILKEENSLEAETLLKLEQLYFLCRHHPGESLTRRIVSEALAKWSDSYNRL